MEPQQNLGGGRLVHPTLPYRVSMEIKQCASLAREKVESTHHRSLSSGLGPQIVPTCLWEVLGFQMRGRACLAARRG